jgi:hypothetical protein
MKTLTNGLTTVNAFEDAIQKYFLPHNIYWMPIDQPTDASVSSTCLGSMCINPEVNNLFTAGDAFGMHFLIWLPPWGFDGRGEPLCNNGNANAGAYNAWQQEVLLHWAPSNPASIAEVSNTGSTVCVLRTDYVSIWDQQMKSDIDQYYKNYGSHPSFAGFLQYYEFSVNNGAYDNAGYSNQTIANFTRSAFYQNVTKYEPYYSLDKFTSNSGSWLAQSASSSGLTTHYTYVGPNGVSDGFSGSQNSSTTAPVTLGWVPKGGMMWQTTSVSNETLWFWPSDTNHQTSTVTVTFNFQAGNNHAQTESYSVAPSITWNTWNRAAVDWFNSYLSTHSSETYNNLTSIQISLTSSSPVTSKLVIANAYAIQVDWLGRTVATPIKAGSVYNFDSHQVPAGNSGGAGYAQAVHGNSLPTGTQPPIEMEGNFGGYMAYEFQSVMVHASTYCQTLKPNCMIMEDQGPSGEPAGLGVGGVTGYHGYSLTGAGSYYGWIQNAGYSVSGYNCGKPGGGCGIPIGPTTNAQAVSYNFPYPRTVGTPYVAGEAIGMRCFTVSTAFIFTCNNNALNNVQAIPYQLSGSYPNQVTPLLWIQTSAESLVSNFTNTGAPGYSVIPPILGATTGQDYAYNERYFAQVANNVQYLGRQPGFSSNPLANILYVDASGAGTGGLPSENFLSPQFLASVGFNVTQETVDHVKYLNLNQFNTIIWSNDAQPNEGNLTTYNDIMSAINHGVGFILVGNAGNSFNGGTGNTNDQLAPNLFGLAYPSHGGVNIRSNPTTITNMGFNFSPTVAKKIFSPYTALSLSDFSPNQSPAKEYTFNTTSTFTNNEGSILAYGNSTTVPLIVAENATGAGHGRMLWVGTTGDTSGLYGSNISNGIFTKQLDIYLNMILYSSKKDSMIPYIWTDSSQPSYYPGVTYSMLGNNNGQSIIWFSDYTHYDHQVGGTSSISMDWNFRGSALGLSSNWIALNLATMGVVNKGSGPTVILPITMQNETWAPIFVGNLPPANLGLVYSNSLILSQAGTSSLGSYTVSGPPKSASWLILNANAPPSAVTQNGQALTQSSSLSSLNAALTAAYGQVEPNNWTPPSGWFYDSSNSLLYVLFPMRSPSAIVVTPGAATTTSSTSSSTSTSTLTTGSSTSTSSSSTFLSSSSSSSSSSSTSTVSARAGVYTLTLAVPSGGGTTQPAPSTYSFAANQVVTLNALPQSGWRFDYWIVNGASWGNGASLGLVMVGDTRVQAWFSLSPQAVLAASSKTASVSIRGDAAVPTQVTVDGTAYPLPASSSISFAWPTGSTHELSAGNATTAGSQTELFFSGWTGSVNSTQPAITITALGDMKLIAGYQVKDLVSISYKTSGGLPVLPSNVVLRGPDGFPVSGTGSSLFWLIQGARYTLVSAEVMGVNVSPLPQWGPGFVVTQPGSLTIPLSIYPVQLKFVDLFNQPIQGASAVLTTEGGQSFKAVTGADGMAYFNAVPFGWYNVTYSYLGLSGKLADTTIGPHVQTMTMALSYPLFTVVVASVVAIALSWLRNKYRNRGVYAAFDGYSH